MVSLGADKETNPYGQRKGKDLLQSVVKNILLFLCWHGMWVGGLWPVSLLGHKCWAINFHFTIPNGILGIDLKGLVKVNIWFCPTYWMIEWFLTLLGLQTEGGGILRHFQKGEYKKSKATHDLWIMANVFCSRGWQWSIVGSKKLGSHVITVNLKHEEHISAPIRRIRFLLGGTGGNIERFTMSSWCWCTTRMSGWFARINIYLINRWWMEIDGRWDGGRIFSN